jgi:hypothetical protein
MDIAGLKEDNWFMCCRIDWFVGVLRMLCLVPEMAVNF